MQIADFFRAKVFNSSDSAFRLALHSDEKINFARKIISAKNENAHARLTKLKPKGVDFQYTLMQTRKYDAFLMMISHIERNSSAMTVSNHDNSESRWFNCR